MEKEVLSDLSKKESGNYEQESLEGFTAAETELARNAYRDGFEDGYRKHMNDIKEKVEDLKAGSESLEEVFPNSRSFTGARMAYEGIIELIEEELND